MRTSGSIHGVRSTRKDDAFRSKVKVRNSLCTREHLRVHMELSEASGNAAETK